MLTPECLQEVRTAWLPNITDTGLDRLIELLEKASPLLVHGCFSRSVPMGCLATQIAWHHPDTEHLTIDAGISWLHHVAGLNPATSHLLRAWDFGGGVRNWDVRNELIELFSRERQRRASTPEMVEVN